MSQNFYIGVDGGATKCIVRLEDENGHLLGRATTGSANIRISVVQAWESIQSALTSILQPLALSLNDENLHFHAGMGLAGCEIADAYHAFIKHNHLFNTLVVSSDAHTACLGAHKGSDGAIIIAGTGVVGFQTQHGRTTKIGGWGFPFDDEGGGAWLGNEAVKVTLKWLDGRLPASCLAQAVFLRFSEDQDRLVTWANQANSTAFAEIAPIVIEQHQLGDAVATKILKQAADALDKIGQALVVAQTEQMQALPCALFGGVAPFIQPYLCAALNARLRPGQLPPDAGAILLVKQYLAQKKESR